MHFKVNESYCNQCQRGKCLSPKKADNLTPRTKSMTLKLSESIYKLLREYAFLRGASHQEVMETALLIYLNSEVE